MLVVFENDHQRYVAFNHSATQPHRCRREMSDVIVEFSSLTKVQLARPHSVPAVIEAQTVLGKYFSALLAPVIQRG